MVFDKVAEILADYKDLDASAVKPESTFEELGFDSLDVVEVIMSLEDEFGVTIEMNEQFKTVDTVVKFIESNK